MATRSYTAIADASGKATASNQQDNLNKGICWVVAQFSLETRNVSGPVFRVGCTATIRRNNSYITSSSLGSADTAYGPPPVLLVPGDVLTCDWAGLTAGDEAVLTLWYDEQDQTTAKPNPDVVV